MLVDYLKEKGLDFSINGEKLVVKSEGKLSDIQCEFITQHKNEIITELKAANDDRKFRFSYHWVLKNNAGGGTLITESPPSIALREIKERFLMDEIEVFELLN